MVLSRTDFGMGWKLSQTLSNVGYMLENGMLTVLELAGKDFG